MSERKEKMKPRTIASAALLVYVGSIVLANYLIVHGFPGATPTGFGTYTVPTLFGLVCPAGTYVVAVSFPARDLVQRAGGRLLGVIAIGLAGLVSWWVSSPVIATASALTFLVSETLDMAVYTPLQRRWFVPAVVASGIVASVVDSVLFIYLANLPTSQIPGLIVAKLLTVTLIGGPAAWLLRKRLPTTETLLPA